MDWNTCMEEISLDFILEMFELETTTLCQDQIKEVQLTTHG